MNIESEKMKSTKKNLNSNDMKNSQIEQCVREAVQRATESLKKEIEFLTAELVEVKCSQEFISNQHDILLAENEELKDLNSKQAKSIHELELKNSKIEASNVEDSATIDDLEQYDPRMNLELEGIPFAEKENINEKVTKLINKMGVSLQKGDISTAHRLPKKSNDRRKHPTTIVRFVNRDKRNEIFFKRRITKQWQDFPIASTEQSFINENLSQKRKRLFWLTKQKAKSLEYKFYWTFNGNIFVRKQENIDKIIIRKEDLDNLK